MSEFNKDSIFKPFRAPLSIFALIIASSVFFAGCSYIPWVSSEADDDLAFEEDFPFEDTEEGVEGGEDDFFENDERGDDEFALDDGGLGDMDDDFASIDQRTDKNELKGVFEPF